MQAVEMVDESLVGKELPEASVDPSLQNRLTVVNGSGSNERLRGAGRLQLRQRRRQQRTPAGETMTWLGKKLGGIFRTSASASPVRSMMSSTTAPRGGHPPTFFMTPAGGGVPPATQGRVQRQDQPARFSARRRKTFMLKSRHQKGQVASSPQSYEDIQKPPESPRRDRRYLRRIPRSQTSSSQRWNPTADAQSTAAAALIGGLTHSITTPPGWQPLLSVSSPLGIDIGSTGSGRTQGRDGKLKVKIKVPLMADLMKKLKPYRRRWLMLDNTVIVYLRRRRGYTQSLRAMALRPHSRQEHRAPRRPLPDFPHAGRTAKSATSIQRCCTPPGKSGNTLAYATPCQGCRPRFWSLAA